MISNREDIGGLLENLNRLGVEKIIAFSGGSESGNLAESIAEASLDVFKDYPVAILNGGTSWGLSKCTTEMAKKRNLPVIGVFPSRGVKYAMKELDFPIEVKPTYGSSEWGDATEIFAKLPHGVEIIEGALGTTIEFAYLMKINEGRIHYSQTPVYIVPIRSAPLPDLSNVANLSHLFPIKSDIMKACMPNLDIYDGKSAADFLIQKLNIKPKGSKNGTK